jgi:exopolyphosphatase/pppGpp-phosphohydrolase
LTGTGLTRCIVAGANIIRTVMDTLGMADVLVSDQGLREGVLIELAKRARVSAWT